MLPRVLVLLLSVLVLVLVLSDAFDTVIMPRTISGRWRLTRLYVRFTWTLWKRIAARQRSGRRRERFLAYFGPFSLLALASVWAVGLVLGFAGLHWAAGSHLRPIVTGHPAIEDLYMSGSTFFTLGLGDVQPVGGIARLITVIEAGTGFAFLAIVIAYFPVLYQAFSRREAQLTLLDAWSGSPPAAAEVLRRLAVAHELPLLLPFLKDWEYWCSALLESHISYPVIAYFRSQHDRQSWVASLATILDLAALVKVGIDGVPTWQAHATFAIARHTAVDLAQVFRTDPDMTVNRLSANDLEQLRQHLATVGVVLRRTPDADEYLAKLRRSYEPYIGGLAAALMMPLPPWWHEHGGRDNWRTDPKGLGDAHL